MLSESQKVKQLKLSLPCYFDRLKSVQLNFGICILRPNLGLRLSLSKITLLFHLSLYLDRTLLSKKKSKVKVFCHIVCVLLSAVAVVA